MSAIRDAGPRSPVLTTRDTSAFQPAAGSPAAVSNAAVAPDCCPCPCPPAQAQVPDLFEAPSAAGSAEVAPTAPVTISELEAQAAAAEQKVMQGARQLAFEQDPAKADSRFAELKSDFGAWREIVNVLVDRGALSSAQVKSFASKTEQSALLAHNLPVEVQAQTGAAYSKAVSPFIQAVCVGESTGSGAQVAAENPLLLVPSVTEELSLEKAKARGVDTTQVTVAGKRGEARRDVVMVFAPGVARTGKEFVPQQQAALDVGVASTRAETGSFIDAETNAIAVAEAIREAKALVGNPDAKVILVGYSQGNTNLFAFMRDQGNRYGDLRKDVVALHNMHSAAGGSHLADLAFALGKWLTTDEAPDTRARALIDAFERANATFFNLPASGVKVIEKGLLALDRTLSVCRDAISRLRLLAGPVFERLGIHGTSDEAVGKRLLELALQGESWVDDLEHQGRRGQLAAKVLRPIWNEVEKAGTFLQAETIGPLIQKYIHGGLYSLTSEYGSGLLKDPRLKANLKDVVILNSTGAVPESRMKELVPPSQRLGYTFFRALGLDSDYQVSVQNQRLGQHLPTAIDLPVEAVGHWGVAGVVVPQDHGEEYFSNFSPAGLTRSVLSTYDSLGIL